MRERERERNKSVCLALLHFYSPHFNFGQEQQNIRTSAKHFLSLQQFYLNQFSSGKSNILNHLNLIIKQFCG